MKKQEIKKQRSITFGYISSWIVVLEIVVVLAIITAYGLVTFNGWLFVIGLFAMCFISSLFDVIEAEREQI